MPGSRKRSRDDTFSEEKAYEEYHPRNTTTVSVGDEKEFSQSTSETMNQAYITQNMNSIGQLVPPIVPVFPSFMTNNLQTSGIRIRLNLPKLVIPTVLLWKEEVA